MNIIRNRAMAKQKTFTQKELEAARQKLAELPDLSQDKLSQAEVLQSLKAEIVKLCAAKGYTVTEVKQALADVGLNVTAKEITELTSSRKRAAPRVKAQTA
ncbi:MobC protein [Pseudomonas cannabina pv. alisalensis]|nr:MobC protein [Pseudomonas cannabina pv. alisalensis]RMN89503.1 MobC protein [Pseudomonas cannabina pv. alisalensis]